MTCTIQYMCYDVVDVYVFFMNIGVDDWTPQACESVYAVYAVYAVT
jgi:hypothetical protein